MGAALCSAACLQLAGPGSLAQQLLMHSMQLALQPGRLCRRLARGLLAGRQLRKLCCRLPALCLRCLQQRLLLGKLLLPVSIPACQRSMQLLGGSLLGCSGRGLRRRLLLRLRCTLLRRCRCLLCRSDPLPFCCKLGCCCLPCRSLLCQLFLELSQHGIEAV